MSCVHAHGHLLRLIREHQTRLKYSKHFFISRRWCDYFNKIKRTSNVHFYSSCFWMVVWIYLIQSNFRETMRVGSMRHWKSRFSWSYNVISAIWQLLTDGIDKVCH